MTKEEGLSNIFDAAGKMGKKPKSEGASSHEAHSMPAPVEPLTTEDLESRFARCKSYYSQIRKTIEDAYSKEHISPVAVDRYLETPSHFPERDWQAIERMKKENLEKLKELVPKGKEPPPEEATSQEPGPKPEKPKPGFVSRKKWIPMR